MNDDHIGYWCHRPRNTRWHLVESEIGLDAVTRCGRRLRDPEFRQIRTHDTPEALCFYCRGEAL